MSGPLAAGLERQIERLFETRPVSGALRVRTPEEALRWQAESRIVLLRKLGLEGRPLPAMEDALQEIREREDCRIETRALDDGEGGIIPFLVLVPRTPPPYPALLAFCGHDSSAEICAGEAPDQGEEDERAYARALVRRGFLVGVPEQRGLGLRVTRQVQPGAPSRSCRHLAFAYGAFGRTLLGERCRDGQIAASALQARADAGGMIGCVGHSGGGATALWLAAIEERIQAAVVSGYFSSFRGSIHAREHCECNYVPGVAGIMEMGGLAALVAPRAFLAVCGRLDPLCPWGEAIREFETVRRMFRLLDAGGRCQLTVHDGGHQYRDDIAASWLEARLAAGIPANHSSDRARQIG